MQHYVFASAGSLITRHCELGASEYAFLPLLASKVSRRAFSYKELALDVKSIIE